jgi:hypothetical protein
MKYHCHFLGLTQEVRKAMGKDAGDTVHVVLQQDNAPRVVEIPEDFRTLLEENGIARFFGQLSFTNRKGFVRWINEAKKEETRNKRLAESIRRLLGGVHHSTIIGPCSKSCRSLWFLSQVNIVFHSFCCLFGYFSAKET